MSKFLRKNYLAFSVLAVGVLVSALILQSKPAGAITVSTPRLPIQPGDITSSKILDGTIVDADVSSTAGIATSKLATSSALNLLTNNAQQFVGVKDFAAIPTTTTTMPTASGQLVSKLYADSLGGISHVTASSGDTFTINSPVFVGDGSIYDYFYVSSTIQDHYAIFNNSTVTIGQFAMQAAQSFRVTSTFDLANAAMQLKKEGTPTGNMYFLLTPDAAGVPSSTIIASTTNLDVSTLTTAYLWHKLAFQTTSSIATGTTYWIIASGTAVESGTAFVDIQTTSAACNTCTVKLKGSGAWEAGTIGNFNFTLGAKSTAGLIYAANAISATSTNRFIGFATAAAAPNENVTINLTGAPTSFSALIAGAVYYLSDSAGAISTTPGEISKKVGVSISSTTLVIIQN